MQHSERPSADLRKLMGVSDDLGATGQLPRSELNDDDNGEIHVTIGADPARGVVVIEFGEPTAWTGFVTPDQAHEIAEAFIVKAKEARGIQ